jgi:hypothetical protein
MTAGGRAAGSLCLRCQILALSRELSEILRRCRDLKVLNVTRVQLGPHDHESGIEGVSYGRF